MFDPERACAAGYLDHVISAEELQSCALENARNLVKLLDKPSYIATKTRLNAQVLTAVREGAKKYDFIA
ncbi:MAG: hypothetical protein COB93_03795 [Sneathiella sp.]|nr:MAG: hypothetical protein COB93_03795 [Sneathiella sp.]